MGFLPLTSSVSFSLKMKEIENVKHKTSIIIFQYYIYSLSTNSVSFSLKMNYIENGKWKTNKIMFQYYIFSLSMSSVLFSLKMNEIIITNYPFKKFIDLAVLILQLYVCLQLLFNFSKFGTFRFKIRKQNREVKKVNIAVT